MNEAEIAHKVLSGLKWKAFIRVLGQVISWAISIVVIRYIKPEEYGLKSMADIFMAVVMIFSSGGLQSAIIQTKELTEEKLKKIFGILIIINLILFVFIFLGAYPIAKYYNEPKIISLIQVMSVGFLLVPFNIMPSALFSRDMEYKEVSSISFTTNVIGGVCTLIMAVMGYGVWSLIAGPLLSSALSVIILNIYKPCLKKPDFSMHGMFDVVSFGGTVLLTSFLWIVFSKADVFIAGGVLSAKDVGVYAVALHLASLPIDKIMPVLNQVAFPAYAKLQDNPLQIAKYFLKSIRLTSLILFPVSFGLVGISHYLIPALLGDKWNDVIPLFFVLGLVFPLRGISTLCAPMTNAIGKPKVQLQLVVLGVLLMVPSFIFAINYGALGLALTWAIVYPVIVLINLVNSIRRINLKIFHVVKAVFAPIFVSSVMLVGLLMFYMTNVIIVNHWFTIGVMILSGAVFYILGMLLLSKKTLYEMAGLFSSR